MAGTSGEEAEARRPGHRRRSAHPRRRPRPAALLQQRQAGAAAADHRYLTGMFGRLVTSCGQRCSSRVAVVFVYSAVCPQRHGTYILLSVSAVQR